MNAGATHCNGNTANDSPLRARNNHYMKPITLDNPRVPVLCLLLSWSMGALGFVLGNLADPGWFARFGSLIVLFSAIGAFSLRRGELTRLYESLSKSEDGLVHTRDFTPSRWHDKKGMLLHLTIVAGTVIWGFGDLLL